MEHGVLRIPDGSGYEELLYQVRHLCADEGARAVRPDPALCRLDYTMSEAGGVTNFVRQYKPCLRRALLRLRIQKSVKEEENSIFIKQRKKAFFTLSAQAKELNTAFDSPYHDTCTEYGCSRAVPLLCDSDDISYTGLCIRS